MNSTLGPSDQQDMKMETFSPETQNTPVEAVPTPGVPLAIVYRQDGIYIELSDEFRQENALCKNVVSYELARRGVGVDASLLARNVLKYTQPFKIAEAQTERDCDSGCFIILGKNNMDAHLMLLPPGGKGKIKSAEEILAEISRIWGVVRGVDERVVTQCVQQKLYYYQVLIAQGAAPQTGDDGCIQFHFQREHDITPLLLPDGTADYKNLDFFTKVAEGDLLATRIPPKEGIDGYTVTGDRLAAKRGKEVRLPKGVNVNISQDGSSLSAAVSGRVDYANGSVHVSNVLEILNDLDMSVGNVDFDGDVIIHGDVIPHLTVKATGNIEVYGSVSGAALFAGSNVLVRNGVLGMDEGIITAGGNVVARFMERVKVESGGDISSDYIVHCTVQAANSVQMKGKKGRIIGGFVRAGRSVTARTIGSPFNEQTTIEVGIRPDTRMKLDQMENERRDAQQKLNRIEYMTRLHPVGKNEPEERAAMRAQLLQGRDLLMRSLFKLSMEIEKSKQEITRLEQGMVHVIDGVYRGVRIDVNSCYCVLDRYTEHVTFKYDRGEVIQTALEI